MLQPFKAYWLMDHGGMFLPAQHDFWFLYYQDWESLGKTFPKSDITYPVIEILGIALGQQGRVEG